MKTRKRQNIKTPRCSYNCDDAHKSHSPKHSKNITKSEKIIERSEMKTRKITTRASSQKSQSKRNQGSRSKSGNRDKLKTTKQHPSATSIPVSGKKKVQPIIKRCYVMITPLPKTVIENKLTQRHLSKIRIKHDTNKPSPTIKSNMVLRKSPRNSGNTIKSEETQMPKTEKFKGTVKTQTLLNDNTQITNTPTAPHKITSNNTRKIIQNKSKSTVAESGLKLRKRKTMNYAESSLEISRNVQSDANKVPIYKQHLNSETKTKSQGDTYEFDSDSEKRKKQKRCKPNNSSADVYNRTVQNILKNIMTKVKRNNKGRLCSTKNNNNIKIKYVKPRALKKTNNIQNKPTTSTIPVLTDAKIMEYVLIEKIPTTEPQVFQEDNTIILMNPVESDDDDVDVCFGFDKIESNKNTSPKIKIISNIQLQPNKEFNLSIATPTKFREGRPNANSTMLNNVLTPWRFNEINIKRNPHFITLKESSLPCINQEMVLDHTIVDKFEDVSKTEATHPPQKKAGTSCNHAKTPIQKTVTDYFDSNTENKENTNVSLFDNDQFSPIKSQSRFNGKVNSVKRKILGERNDNVISHAFTSTPKQNLALAELERSENFDGQKMDKSSKDFTNFGFTSSDEENDELKSPKKNRDDKPFRLQINVNDKKYGKRKLKETEKSDSKEVPSDVESEVSDPSDLESHSGEIKLFEDYSTRDENKFEEPRIIKNKRKLKWMDDDNKNLQKHKRRKDVRTKEEEKEAENWAVAFNSMCKEIEDFPLEIE